MVRGGCAGSQGPCAAGRGAAGTPGEGAAALILSQQPAMSEPAFPGQTGALSSLRDRRAKPRVPAQRGVFSSHGVAVEWRGSPADLTGSKPLCPPSRACSCAGVGAGCLLHQTVSCCLFEGDLLSAAPSSANDSRVSSFPPQSCFLLEN